MAANFLFKGIEVFLLVFVRMTGLFVIAPIFGRRNIPVIFKIAFSFLVAVVLIDSVKVTQIENIKSLWEYMSLVIVEFLIGILIGFIAYLFFSGIYLAGQIIDMQIGFGIVSVLDPMSNTQIPITSNFYLIVTTLVFLMLNGHHILIKAVHESYKYIPIGGLKVDSSLVNEMFLVFGNSFALGFKIAAPITAAIMISDVALGIMSKAMPQLNIFVVGMPLKVFIGIMVTMLTMTMFTYIMKNMIGNIDAETIKVIQGMGYK